MVHDGIVLKVILILLVIALMFVLGGGVGFYVGKKSIVIPPQVEVEKSESVTSPANNLFSSQTASITGKIMAIKGRVLTVKNSDNNAEGEVKLSDSLIVINPGVGGKAVATSSADLSKLDLNKNALISLEFKKGEYVVRLIQFVNPPPSIPPVPVGLQ